MRMEWGSMVRDRFVVALVAIAMLVIGFAALAWTTSLDDYDRWGFRISCGSGLVADYDRAAIADQAEASASEDYVSNCHSAIWWRRGWGSALVFAGLGTGSVLLVRWQREAPAAAQ